MREMHIKKRCEKQNSGRLISGKTLYKSAWKDDEKEKEETKTQELHGTFFVLNLGLNIVDRVTALDFESDGLAS